MDVEFFGLSMSRKMRLCLFIAIPVAVICLVLYFVSGFYAPKEEVVVQLPSGGLSDSVFDLQNMEYKEVPGMTRKYYFANLPYSVDVPSGDFAKVNGADFLNSNPYYFYYTVADKTENLQEMVLSQVPGIIKPNYEGNDASYKVLLEESGNLNGCSGTYVVAEIVVDSKTMYLCLYRLHFDESIYKTENDIFIGCMAEGYTTKNLSDLKELAIATVRTLRFDKERAEQIHGK